MISSRLWLKVLLWVWEPLLVSIFVRWFLLADAKFRRVNCWACRKNGRFLKICDVRGGRNTLNVRKKKTDHVKELYDVAFQLGCDYKVRLWSDEQRKNEDDLVGLLFWKVVTPTLEFANEVACWKTTRNERFDRANGTAQYLTVELAELLTHRWPEKQFELRQALDRKWKAKKTKKRTWTEWFFFCLLVNTNFFSFVCSVVFWKSSWCEQLAS